MILLVDFHVYFRLLLSKRTHLKGSSARKGHINRELWGGLTPPLPLPVPEGLRLCDSPLRRRCTHQKTKTEIKKMSLEINWIPRKEVIIYVWWKQKYQTTPMILKLFWGCTKCLSIKDFLLTSCCSRIRLWVGYFIYFKFIRVFFYLMFLMEVLVQLNK